MIIMGVNCWLITQQDLICGFLLHVSSILLLSQKIDFYIKSRVTSLAFTFLLLN